VDPVPDPLHLRKPGNAGNRTRASESVARKSEGFKDPGLAASASQLYDLSTKVDQESSYGHFAFIVTRSENIKFYIKNIVYPVSFSIN
jgi:hypothetical protein